MDLTALQTGAIQLAAAIAATVNLTFAPADPVPVDPNLQYPSLISSYNLTEAKVSSLSYNLHVEVVEPSESPAILTDLKASEDKDIKLEMVTKEPEAEEELTTVEQPPIIYTVSNPTPKPSASPSQKPQEKDSEASGEPERKEKVKEKKETPAPSPSATVALVQTSTSADQMFQMSNDYRAKLGKPAFEKDDRLCKIAEGRAPMINDELKTGNLHKGFKDLNLPYWATENIAAYSSIQQNFDFWVRDYIHRVALESSHKYSCVACSGTSCSQIFSGFVPK